jgi:hypothetical protein
MQEQVICYRQLHSQRKAAISLYHLHMQSLARVIFADKPVEEYDLFAKDIFFSTSDINERMQYFINDLQEQFPHVGIETYSDLTVECKFCHIPLGWKCPDNPNGYCEYSQESDNQQDWEICIHCGHPEERK